MRLHLVRHSGGSSRGTGDSMSRTRAGAGCLAAAAIAAFVYGLTLSPSVGAGDSGELILAAHSLGIPHPPGYPIWLLLARCADLVPWGTVALRVNALSALLAAAAAGLFYLLAARCGLGRLGRAAGTIVFAASTLVWDNAVQAEVYSLAAALFLLLAIAAIRARSRRTAGPKADALFFKSLANRYNAAANLLTNPALDPVSRMPEFKVCAVRVSPRSKEEHEG